MASGRWATTSAKTLEKQTYRGVLANYTFSDGSKTTKNNPGAGWRDSAGALSSRSWNGEEAMKTLLGGMVGCHSWKAEWLNSGQMAMGGSSCCKLQKRYRRDIMVDSKGNFFGLSAKRGKYLYLLTNGCKKWDGKKTWKKNKQEKLGAQCRGETCMIKFFRKTLVRENFVRLLQNMKIIF